jgi:glutamyl-tRNA synthetase
MHIGNARIAVINYLFCRKDTRPPPKPPQSDLLLGDTEHRSGVYLGVHEHSSTGSTKEETDSGRLGRGSKDGKFLLRIDDTDKLRSEKRYEDSILNDLEWLGISYDEFFRQSEKIDRYRDVMEQLIKDEFLYKCFETPEELEFKRRSAISKGMAPVYDRASLNLTSTEKEVLERNGTPHYWRFRLPDGIVSWNDMILGEISYDLSSISDPVIVKTDGTFLYTFSSVVDDFDSGITHIIRGQDHVTNTAAQIAMFDAISRGEFKIDFAHISLFINKDGSQFSKRLGSMNLGDIRQNGIDPMAISDLLATLGTSLDTIPFFRIDELIDYFDITKFSSNSPKFDIEDISKINKKIIKNKTYEEVQENLGDKFTMSNEEFLIIRDNVDTYSDFVEWQKILRSGFAAEISLSPQEKDILKVFAEVADKTNALDIVADRTKLSGKNLYLPIRLALTGRKTGPHIQQLMDLLGKEEVARRITRPNYPS